MSDVLSDIASAKTDLHLMALAKAACPSADLDLIVAIIVRAQELVLLQKDKENVKSKSGR